MGTKTTVFPLCEPKLKNMAEFGVVSLEGRRF